MDALAAGLRPGPIAAGPDDLAVMPTPRAPRASPTGCMHTHRSVMYNTVSGGIWLGTTPDAVSPIVASLFGVTGTQGGMNSSLYTGSTIVLLPR